MITIHFYVLGKKEVRTWRNVTGADTYLPLQKFNEFKILCDELDLEIQFIRHDCGGITHQCQCKCQPMPRFTTTEIIE